MLEFLVAGFFYFFVFPINAQAYLDPGSGSLIFQVLAASLISVVYMAKRNWSKLTSLFRKDAQSLSQHDEIKTAKRK